MKVDENTCGATCISDAVFSSNGSSLQNIFPPEFTVFGFEAGNAKGRLSVLENSLSLKYVFPSFDNEPHLVSHSAALLLDARK